MQATAMPGKSIPSRSGPGKLVSHLGDTVRGKKWFTRAPIEPLVCLLEFPGVEAAKVSIQGHEITIYRTWDDVWNFHDSTWTSSRDDAARYARRCDGHYTIAPT